MRNLADVKIKLFADGADKKSMLEMYQNPLISGFTTNPSLMRKAGISNYEFFARDILTAIPDRSISFEVFADEFHEMEVQARLIASWGKNVMVKIPVMNTKGKFTGPLIQKLSADGIPLNITALFTVEQVEQVVNCLHRETAAILSIFAGRIADTGVDPLPIMQASLNLMKHLPQAELLWASPRELLNVMQANDMGCHIITATTDILKKLTLIGKDLHEFSQETVQMFYQDATIAGYSLTLPEKAVA